MISTALNPRRDGAAARAASLCEALLGRRVWAVVRRPGALRLGVVLLFFLLWELAARTILDPLFVSPPSTVLVSLPALFADPGVVDAMLTTFWELAIAFALSVAIGLPVGLLVGLPRFSRETVFPIVLLLYAIPQVTVLPLFVLYFGPGPESKIAFGVSHGIFPIIVMVVAGVQNVAPILLQSAHSMGASRFQIFAWVIFPSMVPSFFTGMRLAMTAVLLGVLLAELYVSSGGIGYFTEAFAHSFQPEKLFGLIGTLALMAILLNESVRRAELYASRWRQ